MRTFFAIEARMSEMHLFCSMLMASGWGEWTVGVIGPLCKHPPSNLLLSSAQGPCLKNHTLPLQKKKTTQ